MLLGLAQGLAVTLAAPALLVVVALLLVGLLRLLEPPIKVLWVLALQARRLGAILCRTISKRTRR
jgi:hypothetical protein